MKTVGIVACSNGQKAEFRKQNDELINYLESVGNKVIQSNCIYEKNGAFSGTGKERAGELMRMFNNPEVEEYMIFQAAIWQIRYLMNWITRQLRRAGLFFGAIVI